MTQMTRSEFKKILSEKNHPDMISFISKVPVKMNGYLDYWIINGEGKKKKNPNPTINPFLESGIFNLSKKFKIITGFDYVKGVNRRLEKEGKTPDFVGGYTPKFDDEGNEITREVWFDMISKSLVTDKKTREKFYLRYQYLEDSTISSEYLFNGNPIDKQLFESYMTSKSDSYSNQGLDETLNFQVCDLNNILEVSMGKEKFELID